MRFMPVVLTLFAERRLPPACPGGGCNGQLPCNALHVELSVGLVPAEAREGQLEQKRCYRPDKPDGVLRTLRFVSVAANCGPAGVKPAET